MRALLLAFALATAVAQLPQEQRDDQYKNDPHASCARPEVVEFYHHENPSLHACSCHQSACELLPDGSIHYWDDHTCQLYCSPQRCACHPDEAQCGMEEPK